MMEFNVLRCFVVAGAKNVKNAEYAENAENAEYAEYAEYAECVCVCSITITPRDSGLRLFWAVRQPQLGRSRRSLVKRCTLPWHPWTPASIVRGAPPDPCALKRSPILTVPALQVLTD